MVSPWLHELNWFICARGGEVKSCRQGLFRWFSKIHFQASCECTIINPSLIVFTSQLSKCLSLLHHARFDVLMHTLMVVMVMVMIISPSRRMERANSVQIQHEVLPFSDWGRMCRIARYTHWGQIHSEINIHIMNIAYNYVAVFYFYLSAHTWVGIQFLPQLLPLYLTVA